MDTLFYEKKYETMGRGKLEALQLARLKKNLARVYANNAVYRKAFDEAGVRPSDLKNLADLAKFPTINKTVFRDTYPMGLMCVDKKKIVEMHMSSGSTGTPVVMPYTQGDLDQWASCMSRCYAMAGAKPTDVVQITPSFGLFNGGFGMYHGAHKYGLFVVPTGAGNTARQIKLAADFGTNVFTGVVSYGIRLMEELEAAKVTLPNLRIGIFGAESFSDAMKKKLTEGLGIEVFDIYGMTETGGVGTLGQDCHAHAGIHVWEDHYIVEILDRDTHKPVPDGEIGELAITAITREALPVIRFRTGDLSKIVSREKCQCGRTHLRIAQIMGRVDDMLIVKGVNFFPSQIEQALMSIPGVLNNYQIILEEVHDMMDVRVNVEAEGGVTGFTVEKVLKETLGFSPKGDVFAPGTLPRQEGKAKRVFYRQKDGTLK
ncbi:MAG TPA: phenylacetate--CoA ligase [Treponemataceae bacterium]|nr:phenylacetate--CoA ligase [Treponemataceae bacterium]